MKVDSRNSSDNIDMSQEDALKAMAAATDINAPRPAVADFDNIGSPSIAAKAARRRATAAHTFKRTMIPLLIVVGGLLLLMGTAVAILVATGGLPSAEDSGIMGGTFRKVLVYSAFPMGIFLLVGAWLFHKETKAK